MRERERIGDFRGGHVACRGCGGVIFFAPERGEQTILCCSYLYRTERGPLDMVIYDRLEVGERECIVESEEVDSKTLPNSPLPNSSLPNSSLPNSSLVTSPLSPDDEPSDSEVDGMVASAAEIEERRAEREAQLAARRGPGRPRSGINYG